MQQFDRTIFTETKPSILERFLDVVLAVSIGLCLTMAALAYFDILFA